MILKFIWVVMFSPQLALAVYNGELIGPSKIANSPLVKIHLPANQHCSGSVIGNKAILTAAHCLRNVTASDVFISTNYPNPEGPPRLFTSPVNEIFTSPRFNLSSHSAKQIKFDIAILKLEQLVPSTKPKSILLTPSSHSLIQTLINKNSVYVMGFGRTRQTNPASRASAGLAYLDDASSFVIPTRCHTVAVALDAFDNEVLVLDGRRGAQMCRGDSGGPLFLKDDQLLQIAVNTDIVNAQGDMRSCVSGSIHSAVSISENYEFIQLVLESKFGE